MRNFNSVPREDIDAALATVQDMWDSLDSSFNFQEFLPELSVCSALISILSAYTHRSRHIPVDMTMLQQCISFVAEAMSNFDMPVEIQHDFRTMQQTFYVCCGYSRVKFNGCKIDS